jgi:hypothetical protein
MTTVVFSGHMVDAADRDGRRFPAEDVPRVRADIVAALAGVTDRDAEAISGAACGADLLFAEAWLATGRRLRVFLPRARGAFLDESVRFAGPEWVDAFDRVVADPDTTVVDPAPEMLGLEDPHTANNARMLDAALRAGPPLRGIFVWDGGGGDGPGGTGHMVSQIEAAGGRVTIIEP